MVNTGQPSEACLKCKDRRVKCDETKPACTRCRKLGVVCPGYPARPGILFRDETTVTETKAQKTYTKLQLARGERTRAVDNPSSSKLVLASSFWSSSSIPMRTTFSAYGHHVPSSFGRPFDASSASFFREPLIIGSVSKFIEQWNADGTAIIAGTVTMASNMYPECHPALRATLETLALWTLSIVDHSASRQKVCDAAYQVYGVALAEINRAIVAYKEHELDQVMLAVEMLTIFEILAQLENFEHRVYAHWNGMCQLIINKGPDMFKTELGRRIFLDYFTGIMINRSVVQQPESFPLPSDTPEVLLNSPFTPKLPEYTIMPILQRSFDVKVAAGKVLMGPSSPSPSLRSTIEAIKTESEATIEQLAEWYARAPDFRKKDDGPRNDSKFGFVALIWNLSRVHQILQYDIRVRCNQYLMLYADVDAEALRVENEESVLIVREVVKDIKATMPYTFTSDDPFLSGKRSRSAREIYGHMGYFHPLLICSMTYCLSEKEHEGIKHARQASASMVGLDKPVRSFPRWLVPVPPDSVPEVEHPQWTPTAELSEEEEEEEDE